MKSEAPNTPLAQKTYLTWAEACEYLSLSRNALRLQMYRRKMPRQCWSTATGTARFIRAEIDAWMKSRAKNESQVIERLRVVGGHR